MREWEKKKRGGEGGVDLIIVTKRTRRDGQNAFKGEREAIHRLLRHIDNCSGLRSKAPKPR